MNAVIEKIEMMIEVNQDGDLMNVRNASGLVEIEIAMIVSFDFKGVSRIGSVAAIAGHKIIVEVEESEPVNTYVIEGELFADFTWTHEINASDLRGAKAIFDGDLETQVGFAL